MRSVTAGTFRIDINALRALSVVAVVGFHLQIQGFAGGFVGVDVFLVITGYLMTGKALTDLNQDRFSFRSFTLARMRRIYPALAVTVVASVVAGWFVTMPLEYNKHLLQALSALTFVSNLAFKIDHGYFAMAAQTKPLLHTWSLSVEWQFYILMPLVVGFVWRSAAKSRPGTVTLVLWMTTVLSFAWCLWTSYSDATGSSFFSLSARAWEPLVGGLIAAAEIRSRSDKGPKYPWLESPVAAAAGWALIGACVLYPLSESHWPGMLTVLPVLGAALIVRARQWTGNRSLLGISLVQRLGDWSYSIYLWHWPIWVFALSWLGLRGYSILLPQKLMMVLATVALSIVSYRYVEQPFRMRRDFWTPRKMLLSSGALVACLLGFVALAAITEGFPRRMPEYVWPADEARRMNTPRDDCFRNSNSVKKAPEEYCGFGAAETAGGPSVLLWGDSFANQYLEPISAAALAHGLHGLIATQSACRPFLDDPVRNAGDNPHCRAFNRSAMDFVRSHQEPGIIILGGNLARALEISTIVESLLSAGKTVVVIMPFLNPGFDVPQRWIENQTRAGHAIREWKVEATPELTQSSLRSEIGERLNEYRGNARLILVDPQSVICEPEDCYLVRNGQVNMRDTGHISNVNAIQYEAMFDTAFSSALRMQNKKRNPKIAD